MRNEEISNDEISGKHSELSSNSVFVSYRSTDVNVVRSIVDVLRFNGIDVWFAEYCILPDTWLENDYEKIRSKISQGIKNCDHFIAFTSSGWYASKYISEDEFPAAKVRFESKLTDGITNIVLEEHNLEHRDDPLSHIPQFVHVPTKLRATFDFLEKRLGRSIAYKPAPDIHRRELVIFNGKHSAKMNCWPLMPIDMSVMRLLQGIVLNYYLGINFYFLPKRIQGKVRGLSQAQLKSAIEKNDASEIHRHEEDRRLYYDCAKRARMAGKISNMDIAGLHLVRIPTEQVRTGQKDDEPGILGESAFSITKCDTTSDSRGPTVLRDYSFQLWNGYKKPIGELWISASVIFPGMDTKSAIRTFSGFSQYIDNIALSTVYEGTTNKAGRLQYAWRSSIYLVVLGLIAFEIVLCFPLLESIYYQFIVGATLVGAMHAAWRALRYIYRKRGLLSTVTFRCYEIDENGAKSKVDVKRSWFKFTLIPVSFLLLFGTVLYLGFNLKIAPVLCLIAAATKVLSRWKSIFKGYWFNHYYGLAVKASKSRNFTETERNFKKSLVYARDFEANDNRQASVLFNLALLAAQQGRLEEAMELNIEAMNIYQRSNGPWPDHTEQIKERLEKLRNMI